MFEIYQGPGQGLPGPQRPLRWGRNAEAKIPEGPRTPGALRGGTCDVEE